MVQSLWKGYFLVQKISWIIWATSDKQWKVQKVEISWSFSKKYIPSAKILYTEDLSNISFNHLCENSPNYLCHFLNHQSFFTTQLLCIFLAQTLHTFYNSSPSKWKLSDFPLVRLKFTKFLIPFLSQKVSFSPKFWSFFSVMRDHSSLPFRLKLYMLLTKVAHQGAKFLTCYYSH